MILLFRLKSFNPVESVTVCGMKYMTRFILMYITRCPSTIFWEGPAFFPLICIANYVKNDIFSNARICFWGPFRSVGLFIHSGTSTLLANFRISCAIWCCKSPPPPNLFFFFKDSFVIGPLPCSTTNQLGFEMELHWIASIDPFEFGALLAPHLPTWRAPPNHITGHFAGENHRLDFKTFVSYVVSLR